MAIYTNSSEFGGALGDKFSSLLKQAVSVTVASGYTSEDILVRYSEDFIRIAGNGGNVTLLIGMAIFEGLRQSTYDRLDGLNKHLLAANPSCHGVRVIWTPPPFHGKIYKIKYGNEWLYFAGSSNFSKNGLFDNLEFTCQLTDERVIRETEAYLNWLLDDRISVNLANCASFPIVENVNASSRNIIRHKTTKKVDINSTTPYVDISLSRVDQQTKSNLNTFFGKGRWNRDSGKVIPRDWFEVEITVDVGTTRNPVYPKGDFIVQTDDGLSFTCRTQGDYYKNFRSKDDLKILGYWLKGKLQQKGVLRPFELVTSQTLKDYGRDYIRLYKFSDLDYYLEF